jgi:hypothetical protein
MVLRAEALSASWKEQGNILTVAGLSVMLEELASSACWESLALRWAEEVYLHKDQAVQGVVADIGDMNRLTIAW